MDGEVYRPTRSYIWMERSTDLQEATYGWRGLQIYKKIHMDGEVYRSTRSYIWMERSTDLQEATYGWRGLQSTRSYIWMERSTDLQEATYGWRGLQIYKKLHMDVDTFFIRENQVRKFQVERSLFNP
jgi:hypothetical protein